MAKKKHKKSLASHSFFRTRKGFYSLVLIAAGLMFATIKMSGSFASQPGVLGKNTEEHSRSSQHREEKREERKEEIRKEFKVEPNQIRVKIENRDGIIERKVEMPEKKELTQDDEDELSDQLENSFEEENETEIASDSSGIEIKKNHVKARTGHPLTIDASTNQLIVTRPDGTTKVVTVLPDKAVENFMRNKNVNLINVQDPGSSGSAQTGTTVTEDTTTDQTQITLEEKDEQLVYKIKGKKKLKVLGFIPVEAETTGYVSAETGDVVGQDESLFTKFLNIISL